MKRTPTTSINERGFASLVVALIMILVLSLLTVGFARLARREQQSSLDKQLATQAYYAAETGINDLTKAIPTMQVYQETHADLVPDKCLTDSQLTAFGLVGSVDSVSDISYTCALVDLKPFTVKYDGVGARSVRQTTFATDGVLDSFKVSWGSHVTGHNTYTNTGFKPLADWGNAPAVLQFSLTPLDSVTRDQLIDKTFTVYMYPSAGGTGAIDYAFAGSTDNAPIVSGNCSGTGSYPCSVTINKINNNGATGQYYMARVLNFYDTSDISVNSFKDAGGVQLHTVDAQVQLDVTGKAKNVLKRVQVRTPQHPSNAEILPSAAIDSQGTCKRVATTPVTTKADGSPLDPGKADPDTPTDFGDICDLSKPR